MSGFLSTFKTRKPKQFNFKSRYYDERKERLILKEERILRQIEFEKTIINNLEISKNDKTQFNWQRTDRLAEQKKSNKRIIYIIGILSIIAYVLLQKL